MADAFLAVIYSVLGLWLLAASIFDMRSREVPDWLNFSLIAFGLGARVIYSLILKDVWIVLYGIFGLAIAFLIALVMSYSRQWGDGDSKLLLGIGACIGFSFNFGLFDLPGWPFFIYFFINSMIMGAIYGLAYAICLAVKHGKEFGKEAHKLKRIVLVPLAFCGAFLLIGYFLEGFLRILVIFFTIAATAGMYILIFIKTVERACMYRIVSVNKLVPGDWVAQNIVSYNKIIFYKRKKVIDEEDIKLFKSKNIKNVLVKEGVPFVPAFFLGFVVSLVWGNLLAYLI